MIYCVLDGDTVYPSMSQNIKITRENPELKDKGSYTLDVTFPMTILENQRKFRHLNRIDVSMTDNDYKSATLYVDHIAVIRGIGVITSVSNKEVKLQIMNANSEFKYASGFDKVYIDELYRRWKLTLAFPSNLPGRPPTVETTSFFNLFAPVMINYTEATKSQQHVGDSSIGIYTPVYDETDGVIVNEIVKGYDDGPLLMIKPKCQHNLLHVMKYLLGLNGYDADLTAIDRFPWNRLYIVNTGRDLPHWTLERFITEFKSLFGLSLTFTGNKAVFGRIDYDTEAVSYECLDDFTSEYDDEGIQANSTSNLKYNLYDSEEKTFYTEIPDEVMKAFKIREYASESAMMAAYTALSDKEKAQSIFATPTGYFYARAENVTATGADYTLVRAGQFNKLVRDADNDSAEELGIVPVTMADMDVKFRRVAIDSDDGLFANGKFKTTAETDIRLIMPVAVCEETASEQYTTVQQALEDNESIENSELPESDRMEVFILGTGIKSFNALNKNVKMAVVGTDPTIDRDFTDKVSMALARTQAGVTHIGQFHTAGSRINGRNQRCIKFLCDEIPDPTRIYIFHNKRYACEKIDIEVNQDGIDKVKTGYFYEIL